MQPAVSGFPVVSREESRVKGENAEEGFPGLGGKTRVSLVKVCSLQSQTLSGCTITGERERDGMVTDKGRNLLKES